MEKSIAVEYDKMDSSRYNFGDKVKTKIDHEESQLTHSRNQSLEKPKASLKLNKL